MDFHLQFSIPPFKNKITYPQQLLLMGSCFAENIGEKMRDHKFCATINPHGILYNPASIAVALKNYIENKHVQESDLFFANDCWNSWEHHSRFSNPDKAACLSEINNSISNAHHVLKNANWIFITFGSAFTYTHIAQNKLTGNCHKIPQKEFTKTMRSAAEITAEYNALIKQLLAFNPALNIVFTVSPVRYIRDGVVENNVSKSVLIQSVHELVQQHSNAFYFPAYELVIDDLRDYRFYKQDLVHPTEQAIDYVFEKLMNCCFDDTTKLLFEKMKEIIAAKAHRPFNRNTEAFAKFKATYAKRVEELEKEFKFLNLKEEREYFTSPLHPLSEGEGARLGNDHD